MKNSYSIFLILILVAGLASSSFVEPAFAAKNSIFHSISDAIKYPFHSAAKAVGGWDGPPPKFSGQSEPQKQRISFFTSIMCQILVGDAEKILGKQPLGTPDVCDDEFIRNLFG